RATDLKIAQPVEHAAGGFTRKTVAVFVATMKDVEQRASQYMRLLVRLGEPAGTDPGAEFRGSGVSDRIHRDIADGTVLAFGIGAARRQQPQEMRLATSVRAG